MIDQLPKPSPNKLKEFGMPMLNWKNVASYGLLGSIALLTLAPLLWLSSTALKSNTENVFQSPPQFLPSSPTLDNFVEVFQSSNFGGALLNSLIVAVASVACNLLFCSLAAYPLARLRFRGKGAIWAIVLSTLMIPFQIVMIPLYIITVQLNLVNSYAGIILPNIVSAFGIYLLRQALRGVPLELEEAARIDGCSDWGVWWNIMLPAINPALVTLSIFVFIGAWSDFLWPLIVTSNDQYYTLPLAVSKLSTGAFGSNWRLVAAAAIISIAPVLVMFLFVQKYIVPTDVASGVKG
jgi:putative chitobiose transport system permease protein